jgi:hypothetical protein
MLRVLVCCGLGDREWTIESSVAGGLLTAADGSGRALFLPKEEPSRTAPEQGTFQIEAVVLTPVNNPRTGGPEAADTIEMTRAHSVLE